MFIKTKKSSNSEKAIVGFIAGGAAGAIAKTAIAPLDRVKISFQCSNSQSFSYREAIRFLITSHHKHGFTNHWRGNTATMARIVPSSAIRFSSHELFKHWLNVETNEQKYCIYFFNCLFSVY